MLYGLVTCIKPLKLLSKPSISRWSERKPRRLGWELTMCVQKYMIQSNIDHNLWSSIFGFGWVWFKSPSLVHLSPLEWSEEYREWKGKIQGRIQSSFTGFQMQLVRRAPNNRNPGGSMGTILFHFCTSNVQKLKLYFGLLVFKCRFTGPRGYLEAPTEPMGSTGNTSVTL